MKYIKRFNNRSDYENFKSAPSMVKPLISKIVDEKTTIIDKRSNIISVTYNVPDSSVYNLLYNYSKVYDIIETISIDGSQITKPESSTYFMRYQLDAGEHIIDYILQSHPLYNNLKNLFSYVPHVEHVSIPDNLYSELNYTFAYSSIKTVELGKNINSLYYTFSDSSIQSVTVPESVTSMSTPFKNTSYLETVNLGNNIYFTQYQSYIFMDSPNLQNINLYGVKSFPDTFNYNSPKTTVTLNDITFSPGVTRWGYRTFQELNFNNVSICFSFSFERHAEVFENCSINNLYIDSVNVDNHCIPENFFYNCSIGKITFGPNIKKLNRQAIYINNNLDKLTFPKNINYYNEICIYHVATNTSINMIEFEDGAKDVVLTNSFNDINVRNISIGDITYTYNQYSIFPNNDLRGTINTFFINCKYVYFLTGRDIGSYSINNISFGPKVKQLYRTFYNYKDYTTNPIIIPQNIEAFGSQTFYYTNTSIIFNNFDTLKYIGNEAFYYSKITDPSNNNTFTFGKNLISYGINIFKNQGDYYNSQGFHKIIFDSKNLKFNPVDFYENRFTKINTAETYDPETNPNNVSIYKSLIGSGDYSTAILDISITNNVEVIPECFFAGLSGISEINIPDSVVTIDNGAFFNCRNVSVLNLPENGSLKTIGNAAFANINSSLNEINIPASVETIDHYAFTNCYNVSTLNFAENSKLKYIGAQAFGNMYKLTSVTLPDSVEKIGVLDENTLPNTSIDGLIYNYFYGALFSAGTFAYCNNLKSIHLGSKLKEIGTFCFYGCTSLESLVIPNNVEIIGNQACIGSPWMNCYELTVGAHHISENAFHTCVNVSSLTLTDSVEYIGTKAFVNIGVANSSFTEIYIPKNVKYIGSIAFVYNSSNITSLIVDPENKWYYSENNCIIETSTNTLLFITNNSSIPGTVTNYLGTYNNNKSISSITIPNNIETIGSYTFYNSTLSDITFNNKVEEIGEYAFGFTSLTSVNIPSNITTINNSAFVNCSLLTTVTLSEGLTYIGDYAFQGCNSLTTINIPSTVTYIGKYAFDGCESLTTINLPTNLTTLNQAVFRNCSKLESINLDNITSIDDNVFYNCIKLNNITLNNNLTTLKDYTFYGCSSLTNINLNNILVYGTHTFMNCSSLNVIFPNNAVVYVNTFNFVNSITLDTSNITTTLLKTGFTSVSATYNTNIICSNNVEKLDTNVFRGTRIKSIDLGTNTSYLGNYALSQCYNLKSLYIPSNVKYIGNYAFQNSSMSEIIFESTTPPTLGGYVVFDKLNSSNFKLYVPETALNTYKTYANYINVSTYIWPNPETINGVWISELNDMNKFIDSSQNYVINILHDREYNINCSSWLTYDTSTISEIQDDIILHIPYLTADISTYFNVTTTDNNYNKSILISLFKKYKNISILKNSWVLNDASIYTSGRNKSSIFTYIPNYNDGDFYGTNINNASLNITFRGYEYLKLYYMFDIGAYRNSSIIMINGSNTSTFSDFVDTYFQYNPKNIGTLSAATTPKNGSLNPLNTYTVKIQYKNASTLTPTNSRSQKVYIYLE